MMALIFHGETAIYKFPTKKRRISVLSGGACNSAQIPVGHDAIESHTNTKFRHNHDNENIFC